jgi:hypothetical protein
MPGAFGLLGNPNPFFPEQRYCEANWKLAIDHLIRHGALLEGAVTRIAWSDKTAEKLWGRPTHTVEIHREAPNLWIGDTRVLVTWVNHTERLSYAYFSCPKCARRCRDLYLRDVWACRKCHGLDWACRHRHRTVPIHRLEKLRRKLGAELRPFAPLPPRRRGRSREYHDRLVAMILAEEARLLGHLQTITRDLDRRIRIRKAKGKW